MIEFFVRVHVLGIAVVAVLGAMCVVACKDDPPPPAPPPPPPEPTVPAAVAVVYNATEIWLGNTDYEKDESVRYQGTLDLLRGALTQAPPADAFPPEAQGTLIAYSTGAHARVPMGPLSRIDASGLGVQKDYHQQLGEDLMTGIELATKELAQVDAQRRVLVVFGSGNDTNNEAAQKRYAALRPELARLRVELSVIRFGLHTHPATPGQFGMITTCSHQECMTSAFEAAWRGPEGSGL